MYIRSRESQQTAKMRVHSKSLPNILIFHSQCIIVLTRTHQYGNTSAKERYMFEATEKALEVIKQYVKEQNLQASIRVAMSAGG